MAETISKIEIDRVVREVLAGLVAAPTARPTDTAAGTSSCPAPVASVSRAADRNPRTPSSEPVKGKLVIHGRVVTLADLKGRLSGIRQLVVPPQAVITPAAQDELLQRNIGICRRATETDVPTDALRLAMAIVQKGFDPIPLTAALRTEGMIVTPYSGDCVIAAVDHLAGEIARPGTLAVLLTRYSAAALCLANRQQGVRAVLRVEDADGVGANLLVLDPTARGVFHLKQTLVEFCRHGVRPCPEVFQQRLG